MIVSIIAYYKNKKEEDINVLRAENMQKSNEENVADLMDSISSTLAKEGFRPENHEGVIVFKYEGDFFVVRFEENDLTFFRIEYHIYSFDKQEEYEMLKIVNDLNWISKHSRILIDDDFRIYVRTAYRVNEASNIEDDFWRVFNSTLSAARDFRRKMDYKRTISLN
jgi:hypothetical protein